MRGAAPTGRPSRLAWPTSSTSSRCWPRSRQGSSGRACPPVGGARSAPAWPAASARSSPCMPMCWCSPARRLPMPDPTLRAVPASPELVPLSVWPVAQTSHRAQRIGRYLPCSAAHPARMLPALARYAIERYSTPGGLVVDPLCGIGTTLVEAVHLGRDALGVELEPRWAELAERNLAHAMGHGGGRVDAGRGAAKVRKWNAKYTRGPSRANLATAGEAALLAGMVEVLAACTKV